MAIQLERFGVSPLHSITAFIPEEFSTTLLDAFNRRQAYKKISGTLLSELRNTKIIIKSIPTIIALFFIAWRSGD